MPLGAPYNTLTVLVTMNLPPLGQEMAPALRLLSHIHSITYNKLLRILLAAPLSPSHDAKEMLLRTRRGV
jgi:hypothetical protein